MIASWVGGTGMYFVSILVSISPLKGSGSSGMSALHYTAESPFALCAEALLEARADPNAAAARVSPDLSIFKNLRGGEMV